MVIGKIIEKRDDWEYFQILYERGKIEGVREDHVEDNNREGCEELSGEKIMVGK